MPLRGRHESSGNEGAFQLAEVDTLERTSSRKVQVANLPPADSGRGVARLPVKLMEELKLSEGDVIEID